MLINNFEEWKLLKIENTPDDQLVPCADCCGEYCGLCEGDGKIRFGDVPSDKVDMLFNKDVYHDEIISDLERFASWEGKNRIDFLLENGYSVYTLVANKIEIVRHIL